MTTIAYNHKDKEIAVDSRCTNQGKIVTDAMDKSITISGVTYFYTASGDDGEKLAKIISGSSTDKDNESLDAAVMFIKSGKAFMGCYSENKLDTWLLTYSDSIGSGCDFALAAMDFGKTAKESVEYAATRNHHTGGEVRVFKVE